jgi:hypothetical protein
LEAKGFLQGSAFVQAPQQSRLQVATKPLPLSSAARDDAWRHTAKWFSVYEYASGANAAPRSSSALIATGVIATAAWSAAGMHGSSNTAAPTAAIAKAPRRGSIVATGNVGIDNAVPRPACRIMVHF